jgi:uncharacterized repeat protein (TIGR01451 family)
LTNVVVTNPLPAQATFVRASEAGYFLGTDFVWSPGALAPRETRTLEITFQAQALGQICNRASARAEPEVQTQAEFCTDFIGEPALSLDVRDTVDPLPAGGTTTYNIVVHNPGTKTATNVRVVATVPDQMEVSRAAGTADFRKEGQRVIFEPFTLQAGNDARFQIDVKALRPGDIRFKVDLTADSLEAGPVQQEESTTVYPSLPAAYNEK